MSYDDFMCGLELAEHDYPFYGLIQAAIRVALMKQTAMIKAMIKADTKKMRKLDAENLENLERLKKCFPAAWDDLKKRYVAPEGKLWREKEISYLNAVWRETITGEVFWHDILDFEECAREVDEDSVVLECPLCNEEVGYSEADAEKILKS